jgi:hypothetical protein
MQRLILYKDNKNKFDVIEEEKVVINNKKVYQNNKKHLDFQVFFLFLLISS